MKSWLIGKDSNAGRDWGQEEKGMTEDEMAGWHHWLDGRESEWTPGVGDGQEGLACYDSWDRKESDTTEWLNWTEQKQTILRTGGKNTQKNCRKKILTTQIIMMVWSLTHLEPDILECEVKWALGSTTTNKASRGEGIPVKLFQILKDDAVKGLHSICQQVWKTQHGHRTGKGQFSFQSHRKTMPKNTQTTAQLPWSHTLLK